MFRRFRRLGALLALAALSTFYAESVWAATCPPDGGDAAAHGAMHGSPDAGHAAGMAGMHHPMQSPEDGPRAPQEAPGCPMQFAGASGCVPAPLASAAQHERPVAEPGDAVGVAPDPARDRLCATSTFHPPRP
jgi:hypothetical protein